MAASMRTAARAVKSASGEKDQTELRGKIISKTVRIGPMEKVYEGSAFQTSLLRVSC